MRKADNLTTFMWRLSWNLEASTFWNPQALSRPVMGCLYFYLKAAGAEGWQLYHLHVPIVLKSGILNLLETSGPVQACNEIALP